MTKGQGIAGFCVLTSLLAGCAGAALAEEPPAPVPQAKSDALEAIWLRGGASLEEGGFRVLPLGIERGAPVASPFEPAFLLSRRLLERGTPEDSSSGAERLRLRERARDEVQRAVGDTLIHSVDPGFGTPYADAWESSVRLSGGAAGPEEWVSFRVPSRALAVALPADITDVRIGFDNYGAYTVFPVVELSVEDAAAPLQPRAGASVFVNSFDTTALLSAPASGATRPSDFQRLSPGLEDLTLGRDWVTDGAFRDGFDRTGEPLDNAASDWLECDDGNCLGPQNLFVYEGGSPECGGLTNGCAVRTAGGAVSLGVKFPAADIAEMRPAQDAITAVSVQVDVSAPSATRAGVAARILAADTYYRIEYDKASGSVEVDSVVGGVERNLGSLPVPAPSDTLLLRAMVLGSDPVNINVFVDGNMIGTVSDDTDLLAGVLAGLVASDTASSAEAWDEFDVERRPDVFVNVQFPAGGLDSLPLDVSEDSVLSWAVLTSYGGQDFEPRTTEQGCGNPGNPFLQLEVTDTTTGAALFEDGVHVVRLAVDCPTCPEGRNRCFENWAVPERYLPSYTTGETHQVAVSFWNEHIGDADFTLNVEVFDLPCALVDGQSVPIATDSQPFTGHAGQDASGPVLESAVLGEFVPAVADAHCVVVYPTAREGVYASVPSALYREIDVYDAGCVPKSQSNVDPVSFRVSKAGGDPILTRFSWQVLDPGQFPADVNLHAMKAEPFDSAATGFEEFAPIYATIAGTDPPGSDVELEAPTGVPAWLAIYETDGCPTGNSVLP